jgi:hypothetical protein
VLFVGSEADPDDNGKQITGDNKQAIHMRKRVCLAVTSSEYFNVLGRDPVDAEEEYPLLVSKYPSIKKNLFEEVSGLISSRTRYTNPMRPINVAVSGLGELVVEQAFVCTARDRRTQEIEEYYVSRPYNVSESISNFVSGYFIFKHIAAEKLWIIHSFAEQKSKVTASTKEAENIYRQLLEEHESGIVNKTLDSI